MFFIIFVDKKCYLDYFMRDSKKGKFMILIFNKQYRQESGLISDLVKKIKKSNVLERQTQGNTEIYTLENIIISFDILASKLTVCEKNTGETILDMDCNYVAGRSDAIVLQNARFDMFSHLLNAARTTCEANVKEAKRQQQALKIQQERQAVLNSAQAKKAAAEAAIATARQRLKSL